MYFTCLLTFNEIGPTSVFLYVYNVHEASSLRTFGSSGNFLFTIGYGPRVSEASWNVDGVWTIITV